MQFSFLQGVKDIKDLSSDLYNSQINALARWWNDHDSGSRAWTVLSGIAFGTKATSYTSSPTLTDNDQVALVDSTSAARTVTLPTAVGRTGRRFTVKDWKGTSGTNAITIDGNGSETIDGATTYVIALAYQSITIVSDGANWAII